MKRVAFKMKLHAGQSSEYKRRHDAIWPELTQLLKGSGISDYAIYLDEETLALFGVMKVETPELVDRLPEHPVMKKWWSYMKDIMDSNPDGSPVTQSLNEVFYLH
jgi:L-rhamnose mutarotase